MRKELCRNFQRGSCRFGEACRFLHPQQAKPNNPFGFGTQTQQQQQPQPQQQQKSSNPFGFGVQGGSNKPNQFQPFENKWQRNPSTPGGGGASAQQTGKQTQQAEHKCTDPAACKRIMQDDFKNERPMWKLTCYGHWKWLPCDITGDISYEELRAMAYDEAKRGIPLQSIVERERNLQNSKVAEFENFLRSPYQGSLTVNQSPFAAPTPSNFPPANQINSPPPFSGFNQQPAFPNTNPGGLSSSGPPNPFASFNQQPNAFSVNNTPQPFPSGPSGFQTQPSIAFKPASFGPGPGLFTAPQNNNMFPSVTPTPALNISQNNQSPFNFNNPVASFTAPVIDTPNTSSGTELQLEGASVDTGIWLKEKWNPGEIPEQAPPDAFV
uniref:Zinc finger CCCH domain-containing protein 16 n=1 Tax=Noccaea caerulescens TaxID=107243 RepID=A0A1J3EPX8_NOCCA